MNQKNRFMKRSARAALALAFVFFATGTTAFAEYEPLEIDTVHSKVGFTASTLLFDVDGEFEKFVVEIEGDPSKPESVSIRATIDVASIDTQNAKRDDHLRSPDFFHAEKHPQITFKSSRVRKKGDQLIITGTLSMRGKDKVVAIPFKVAEGKNGAGVQTKTYKGKLTIDRNDFGVGSDSVAAKISLEDEVDLKLLIVTFP